MMEPKGLKFVQLLSGGKDSIFSLIHAIANYHVPLGLVNLGPPPLASTEELDSFLYQSIGHSAIPHIAHALDLPLFTRTIRGTPLKTELGYGSRLPGGQEREEEEDEAEDLFELLSEVKRQLPEVEAVSVGAILSNYQRLRVENICSRLNLIPLAYLWELDQRELLQSMISAEMNSVLIKVAGAGLTTDHLGKSLREMQGTLRKLNGKWGTHECGEGGEYETFTLDCPLYRETLVISKSTLHVPTPDPVAPVAHLSLDLITRIPKPDYQKNETHLQRVARMRQLLGKKKDDDELDERSKEVEEAVIDGCKELEYSGAEIVSEYEEGSLLEPTVETTSAGYLAFSNIVSPLSPLPLSLSDELDSCFALLSQKLYPTPLTSLLHLSLFLSPPSSMSLFPTLNKTYASYFGTQPPTRACLALAGQLPGGRRIMLEGWAAGSEAVEKSRYSLHVQSRSYWAAANIGPYSQAISTDKKLFVAGQIGLIPSSLELAPTFEKQCAMSLQHLRRIVESSDSKRWKGGKGNGVCWILAGGEWDKRVAGVRRAVELEDELLGEIVFVEAGALPKGAKLEWQVTFDRQPADEEDSEDESSFFTTSQNRTGIVGFCAEDQLDPAIVRSVQSAEIGMIRAFHLPSVSPDYVKDRVEKLVGKSSVPISAIASGRLTLSPKREEVDIVLIWE